MYYLCVVVPVIPLPVLMLVMKPGFFLVLPHQPDHSFFIRKPSKRACICICKSRLGFRG